MRVIKPITIQEMCAEHPKARPSLERWLRITKAAEWKRFADVRKIFQDADEITVASGRKTVIFDIGGNNFRLITAIHYNTGLVYVMKFLTHAEYSKETWKGDL